MGEFTPDGVGSTLYYIGGETTQWGEGAAHYMGRNQQNWSTYKGHPPFPLPPQWEILQNILERGIPMELNFEGLEMQK